MEELRCRSDAIGILGGSKYFGAAAGKVRYPDCSKRPTPKTTPFILIK